MAISSTQDCFVLKFPDGKYYSSNLAKRKGRFEKATLILDLEDANYIKNLYANQVKLEIIPVRVIVKEIKKRDILCYNYNCGVSGWSIRSDAHMNFFWKCADKKDLWALTD